MFEKAQEIRKSRSKNYSERNIVAKKAKDILLQEKYIVVNVVAYIQESYGHTSKIQIIRELYGNVGEQIKEEGKNVQIV